MNDDEESDVKSGAEVQKPKSIVTRRAGQKTWAKHEGVGTLKNNDFEIVNQNQSHRSCEEMCRAPSQEACRASADTHP